MLQRMVLMTNACRFKHDNLNTECILKRKKQMETPK